MAIAGSAATLSYFTDTSEVVNSFTIGSVDTTLFRWHDAVGGSSYDKASAERLNRVYDEWLARTENILVGGKKINFMPYVTNTGNIDVYVRVKVWFPAELFNGGYIDYDYGAGVAVSSQADGTEEFVRKKSNVTVGGKDYVLFTFIRNQPLVANTKTISPIFTTIGLKNTVITDNPDLSGFVDSGGKLNIQMTSEAVQAYGFSSATDAFNFIDR